MTQHVTSAPSLAAVQPSAAPRPRVADPASLPADAAAFLALSPDAVLVVDAGGTVIGANELACELLGYPHEELAGLAVDELVPGPRRAAHAARRESFAEVGAPRPMSHAVGLRARRRDGSQVPVDIALRPLTSPTGPLVLCAVRDMTEQERAREELRRRAATDPLTGLPNHGTFHTALDGAVAAALAHGEPLSLVAIDVDRFRSVNEQHGHPLGDEALRGIAEVLRSAVRRGELVGRIGGEEFGLVLPGAGLDAARRAAERVRRAVEAAALLPGDRVTVSAGACDLESAGGSAQRLLALADAALYEAKRRGRNRVCVHGEPPGAAAGAGAQPAAGVSPVPSTRPGAAAG